MGICGSRLRTCRARPRQASNVTPSFSAKAWRPHLIPHVAQGCFCVPEEGRQLLVIVQLVFVHVPPCVVSLGVQVVCHGLCSSSVMPSRRIAEYTAARAEHPIINS